MRTLILKQLIQCDSREENIPDKNKRKKKMEEGKNVSSRIAGEAKKAHDKLKNIINSESKICTNLSVIHEMYIEKSYEYEVFQPETKKSELVEIKYREFEFFNWDKSIQIFPYRSIKEYMEYWHDAILIIVMNVAPFALAIPINDIDWNKHFVGKRVGTKGLKDDLWLFSDIQKQLPEVWSKVTHEII